MKKSLILTAFLVLGLAGCSLWVSLQVEATNLDVVARVEARPDVRVIESRFDRGWLTSTAETHLEFRGAVGTAFRAPLEWAGRHDVRKRVGFVITQHIDHGPSAVWTWLNEGAIGSPLVAISHGTVVMDQEAHSEVAAVFGKLPNATWLLRVRANRNMDATLAMRPTPLNPRDVEAGTAPRWVGSFAGLQGQLHIAADQVEWNLTSPGLELAGSDFAFDLDGWTAHWKGRLTQEDPIAGEHSLRSLQVHFKVPGLPEAGRRLSLQSAEWTTESDEDGLHLTATSEEASVDALSLRGTRMVALWPRDPQADPSEKSMTSVETGFLPEWEIVSLEGRLPEGPVLISGRLQRLAPSKVQAGVETPMAEAGDSETESIEAAPTAEASSVLVGDLDVRFPERWVGALFGDDADRFAALLAEGQLARDGSRIRTRLMWNENGWLANGLPLETDGWLEAVFPPMPEAPVAVVDSAVVESEMDAKAKDPEAAEVSEGVAPEAEAAEVPVVSEPALEDTTPIAEILEGAPTDAPPASPAP